CEIGGTVGDIESLPFLETIRQFPREVGKENVVYIHLTLVPYVKASCELKTKPTQHSVHKLREIGISPNIVMCRSEEALPEEVRSKIALFCNVDSEAVISARDVPSIYAVPLEF
ncbi:CTP synthase, partial [mine drainage metagenome]